MSTAECQPAGACANGRALILMLRCISFAPKGRPQKSPGQRPGWRLRNLRQSPVRATIAGRLLRLFRAFSLVFRGFSRPQGVGLG